MKKCITTSVLLFVITAWLSVSCAASTVPVATMKYEKALTATVVSTNDFDGAITLHSYTVEFQLSAIHQDFVAVEAIHWPDDEWFYIHGYKAKLSNAVEEIIAPPDKIYFDIPIKIGWC